MGEEALEEEALEEVASEEVIGVAIGVAMVAHQTGAGPQLGGKQARRRRNTSSSWNMMRMMMMKMKSLQSLEMQEKSDGRGKYIKEELTKKSRLGCFAALFTSFNQMIKYLFRFLMKTCQKHFICLILVVRASQIEELQAAIETLQHQ